MDDRLFLLTWTALGLSWLIVAWRLAAANARRSLGKTPEDGSPPDAFSLTLFKPLPRLGPRGLEVEGPALESFVAQMDERTEMLLGVHEADRETAAPFLERMAREYPGARLRAVFGRPLGGIANPKIAWQKVLAAEALGDLWLWSDADIAAPPGFLRRARAEFARARGEGIEMVTFPYAVAAAPTVPSLLAALFVNVEFYPGVLFLRGLGEGDFGLGAAMLFSRDAFARRVDWERLGAALADDFALGRALRPVRIGAATVFAVLEPSDARAAVSHYLRWQKTIRWCRPLGFAGQIAVLPVLGWLGAVLLHPGTAFPWLGLAVVAGAETVLASLLCREAGCRWRPGHLPMAAAWSVLRPLVWAACWLPWPVIWRDRRWWGAQSRPAPEPAFAGQAD